MISLLARHFKKFHHPQTLANRRMGIIQKLGIIISFSAAPVKIIKGK